MASSEAGRMADLKQYSGIDPSGRQGTSRLVKFTTGRIPSAYWPAELIDSLH